VSRHLATSVVVITGASSGIGRAAGQAFGARAGDRAITGGWKSNRRGELARAFVDTLGGAARGLRGG
jgi:NAD(P)-dependent dehydrogenase (short-subunit alcohol dehydrogenase family)